MNFSIFISISQKIIAGSPAVRFSLSLEPNCPQLKTRTIDVAFLYTSVSLNISDRQTLTR